jgi:hypothetical protein
MILVAVLMSVEDGTLNYAFEFLLSLTMLQI